MTRQPPPTVTPRTVQGFPCYDAEAFTFVPSDIDDHCIVCNRPCEAAFMLAGFGGRPDLLAPRGAARPEVTP